MKLVAELRPLVQFSDPREKRLRRRPYSQEGTVFRLQFELRNKVLASR